MITYSNISYVQYKMLVYWLSASLHNCWLSTHWEVHSMEFACFKKLLLGMILMQDSDESVRRQCGKANFDDIKRVVELGGRLWFAKFGIDVASLWTRFILCWSPIDYRMDFWWFEGSALWAENAWSPLKLAFQLAAFLLVQNLLTGV